MFGSLHEMPAALLPASLFVSALRGLPCAFMARVRVVHNLIGRDRNEIFAASFTAHKRRQDLNLSHALGDRIMNYDGERSGFFDWCIGNGCAQLVKGFHKAWRRAQTSGLYALDVRA